MKNTRLTVFALGAAAFGVAIYLAATKTNEELDALLAEALEGLKEL